jgi:hypothetical protein
MVKNGIYPSPIATERIKIDHSPRTLAGKESATKSYLPQQQPNVSNDLERDTKW